MKKTIIIMITGMLLIAACHQSYEETKRQTRMSRQEAQRLEEEIEAKSTAEIEEELRRAMAREEEKQSSDNWKSDPGLEDLDLSKDKTSEGGAEQ